MHQCIRTENEPSTQSDLCAAIMVQATAVGLTHSVSGFRIVACIRGTLSCIGRKASWRGQESSGIVYDSGDNVPRPGPALLDQCPHH